MGLVAVKDPSVLSELEGGPKPVSDPAVLAELEGGASVTSNLAKIDAQREAQKFEEPSTFSYLFNRIKKGAAGFMGAPGDLIDLGRKAASYLPNVPIPGVMGIQALKAIPESVQTKDFIATSPLYQEAFGYDPKMKTGSDLKRYAGGVVEMGTAGGPFALAAPAAQIPAIITGAVGSGIGMEAGGDIAAGLNLPREAGEAAGALVGGVTSAIAPNALTAAGGAVKRRFSPNAQKASAESAVGREIAEQIETYPPAKANIDRSLEISDEIPGFNPSLPARSGAPGLLAEERRLVSESPKTLNKAVQNVEENNRAIAAYIEAKFPKVGGETAVDRVNRLRDMNASRLEGIRTAIDEKLDDAVRVFESNPTNHENGNRLRDLFFKQKEVYSGIRSQKYQAVYESAERLGVKANIDDTIQYADDVLKSEFNAYQASEIPPVFRQLAKTDKGVMSFAKLHSLYKRANGDIASLRGSSTTDRDYKLHLLEQLRTKLRAKLDEFEGAGYGETAEKLKEANRFYAEEYVPRFKQGFGSDVAAKYSSGEFRTVSDHVVDLIAKPRNVQGAKDFRMLFDDVPEAWDALRAGYLDKLYKSGGVIDANGRINQKALDRFMRQHGDTLSELGPIKKDLEQLALDNGALLERRAYVVKAQKELASHDLYRLFQGRDPAVILTEATTNPNAMRALAFQARNDPNMAKGLSRGIAEHVTQQADPMAFLTANEEAIRIGLRPLGEEHFKNLKTAVEAMTINSRTVPPQSVSAGSVAPDAIAEKLGSSPRAIISHFLNVQRGRTGAAQEGAAFLGRWFDKLRRDHKAVAMEAIFYDKDAARALANLAKNPASEKARMDFATQMTSLGVRAEVAWQE